MSVTLADIGGWDPGALRDVATALSRRGASAEEVKVGLSKLPLISSWLGTGGDSARASLDKLSAQLATHADEMTAVSAATGKAADEVETLRQTLRGIDDDAKREGFTVDPHTGAVTPTNKDKVNDPGYQQQQADLVGRIKKLLADADELDANLARVIATNGGDPTQAAQIDKQSGDVPQTLTGKQFLDDLKRANDKSVLDAMNRVKAAQAAIDRVSADAYTHAPGSPEFKAANDQLPKLKQDLASALDDLGKIPDYSKVDPNSVHVDANGNVLFSYTRDGQTVQVTGNFKNGTGQLFDQGRLSQISYQNGKITGVHVLDEGRAIATSEPLLTAVTTAVGAGPTIKAGQEAWAGLRALFAEEGLAGGASVTADSVLPHAVDLAATRAENAAHELAAMGPGSWTSVTESMSARSAEYQMQITGHPITEGYVVNGVKFDGFANGVLNDAKGYYGQFIENGQWKPWFSGEQSLLDQAARQVAAAGGTPIQWTFAEKASADLVREMLMHDYPQIQVIWVPPK